MRIGPRVVEQNQLARAPSVPLAEVRLEPALPVAVAERGGARRDRELARHEVVVGDRIGREVREVAQRERVQRLVARLLSDLEAHVPRVAVSAGGRVLLGDARIGRDRPVQEIVRERGEQLGDVRRQERERAQTASPRKTCVPGVQASAGGREERDGHDGDQRRRSRE